MQAMGRRCTTGDAAPRALSVEMLCAEGAQGEEFAVFSWDATECPPAAAGLTCAEQEVLQRVVAGASNAQIAAARGTSIRTLANQVASLLHKLGAESRFELIRRFGASYGKPGSPA
jgi:DNA-binding CsgD family transcriptional regulator